MCVNKHPSTMEANEVREAIWTFTACLALTGALGIWWSILYWNIRIRKVVRGSERTLGFIQEQEQLDRL